MSDILYLSDRTFYTDKDIPRTVLDELRHNGLIAPDMKRIHFCGVISYNDGLAVFLPRNHNASMKDGGAAGHFLLQALLKYYQDKDTGTDAQEGGENVIGGSSFSLATSLLNDYQSNGLYVRRVKKNTLNSGKVNWIRTISRSMSYPTVNGPIYLDLSTSRSRYIADCETAKIHAEVIKELFTDYGMLWLGTIDYHDEKLESQPKPLGSIDTKIAYLQRELRLSYSEREMFLIRSLIQYLQNRKGTNTNNILIGVREFHNLWESMLDECLIGKYDVNRKLPIPFYRTTDGDFEPIAKKGQKTDTVLKLAGKNQFAVIDAKYYEASSPQTAPGWPDLVKQFFYQKAVAIMEDKSSIISNHFIFPGSKKALKAVYVAKRDITVESKADCLLEYPPIYCHYQDPIDLLEVYVKDQKLKLLTDTIFGIKKLEK